MKRMKEQGKNNPTKCIFRVYIDSDLRNKFEQFCERVGLRPSKAVELYMKKTVSVDDIPFELNSNN